MCHRHFHWVSDPCLIAVDDDAWLTSYKTENVRRFIRIEMVFYSITSFISIHHQHINASGTPESAIE